MFSSRKLLAMSLILVTLITLAIGCDREEREQLIEDRLQEREQQDQELQQAPDAPYRGSQTISWGNLERDFRVHVPPTYSPDQALPLVVALHPGGSNAFNFELVTGLSNLADIEGFIVVYPNGTSNTGAAVYAWNAGHCCAAAVDDNVDDVGFLENMITVVSSNLNIDYSRIYFTGFSNGGIMSYRFAAERSDIVAAIAPVEATIGGKASLTSPLWLPPDPSSPVSVLAIHGTEDPQVLYEGGHGPNTKGTRVDISVEKSIEFWVQANGCDSNSPVISDNNGVEHIIYSGGNQGTVVELITIEGGKHVWPGSNADKVQKVDATPVVWQFFKDH